MMVCNILSDNSEFGTYAFPVIKNIEEEDRSWQSDDRRREKRRLKKEEKASKGRQSQAADEVESKDATSTTVRITRPPGFY